MKVRAINVEGADCRATLTLEGEDYLTYEQANEAVKKINLALRAYERSSDQRDRSHIPPHTQRDPNARSWHWNEHPKGKFPR